MNSESMKKLMNLIDDSEITDIMGRVSDNLDRTRRMKDRRQYPEALKARARDIRASLASVVPDMKLHDDRAAFGIALVLTGGGAKGSFQIGACKVLEENGYFDKKTDKGISSIAGTSSGALNAALIAGGSLSEAEALWNGIEESRMNGKYGFLVPSEENDRYLQELILESGVLPKITPESLLTIVTAFDYGSGCPRDFILNYMTDEEKNKCLLASSAFPVALKEQDIDGVRYIDGGIPVLGSNMPVAPLYYLGYRRFIVIHCASRSEVPVWHDFIEADLNLNRQLYYNGASFVHVYSSRNLGGILGGTINFNHETIMNNLSLGSEDMQKALGDLAVFSEEVGEYDEVHVVNGERYRSFTEMLENFS